MAPAAHYVRADPWTKIFILNRLLSYLKSLKVKNLQEINQLTVLRLMILSRSISFYLAIITRLERNQKIMVRGRLNSCKSNRLEKV